VKQSRVQHRAAHVIEIDAYASWAQFADATSHVIGLVIDRRIQAELVDKVRAFIATTRNADHAAA
jgi:hypothetical protein